MTRGETGGVLDGAGAVQLVLDAAGQLPAVKSCMFSGVTSWKGM